MTDIIAEHFPVIVEEFGAPDAWAVTAVDSTMDQVPGYSWRTTGYLGALRQLQTVLRENGYNPDTGSWRIYEFTDEAVPDVVKGSGNSDRVVIAVAKGVTKND